MEFDFYCEKVDRLLEAGLDDCLAELSSCRRARALRYAGEADRRSSAAASLLLQKGLKKYGIDEKTARYEFNRYGKPFLTDYPDLHFSLSHSGEYAAAALGYGELGCDIQQIGILNTRLLRRFFSESEAEYVLSCNNPDHEFFRLWAIKESFLKAIGTGLYTPLTSFEVLSPQDDAHIIHSGDTYCIAEKAYPGLKCAVCFKKQNKRLNNRQAKKF